ncbi:MAG: hypothetical protein KAQ87_00820 [Candidatus Pacebacteria bacterium]|nr:hypothetical protein [Candidatus Paceibacterota bacterium]
MESEIETTDFNKKGWIGKIKDWSYENWQTILVVLIVLIVGMSAYNYNQQNNLSGKNSSSVAIVDNDETEVENIDEEKTSEENNIDQEKIAEADIESKDQAEAAKEDNEMETNANEEKNTEEENNPVISTSNDSGKIYTVYANRGEGITHLARRALNEYLQEIGEESELTKEHKIYIEDYLQNRTGTESIEVSYQGTFSENLIEEAVSSAKQLTPNSINNLSKYIK